VTTQASLDEPEPTVHSFLEFAQYYLARVDTFVELGARDCVETEALSKRLPQVQIYAFECNAHTLPVCRERAARLPNVTLVEKAASDRDGVVPFFPIDVERTRTPWVNGNPGASSMFQASGNYPDERYVQTETKVPSVTLSTFMASEALTTIDLLWMDIQGAELMALQGLGQKLSEVKLIHTEIEFFGVYSGAPLSGEIKHYLNQNGFLLVGFTHFNRFFADAVFVNKSVLFGWRRTKALICDIVAYHAVRLFALAVRSSARMRRLSAESRELAGHRA
jgi:FkbM family methyltransferase